MIRLALERAGQPPTGQADVGGQVDAKELVGVSPEIRFAHRVGVVGKEIRSGHASRHDDRRGAALDDLRPERVVGWQHRQVTEVGVVAVHAEVVPTQHSILGRRLLGGATHEWQIDTILHQRAWRPCWLFLSLNDRRTGQQHTKRGRCDDNGQNWRQERVLPTVTCLACVGTAAIWTWYSLLCVGDVACLRYATVALRMFQGGSLHLPLSIAQVAMRRETVSPSQ